ncbi:hypothetical protein K457DRAFT_250615 [Linnemannia elongata AG-77]|uniref:Uncharacterized protein n=1 Tax=Linnemannia elongata AG-77 TaxID=1314771 RepID=A0A197K9J8_9FUNG|nr:hypothetical protein K457DRAFT_250615 [Linnemannia elongata AG-77]
MLLCLLLGIRGGHPQLSFSLSSSLSLHSHSLTLSLFVYANGRCMLLLLFVLSSMINGSRLGAEKGGKKRETTKRVNE